MPENKGFERNLESLNYQIRKRLEKGVVSSRS